MFDLTEGNIYTIKCKICPEHKVQAKLYAVPLIVDEDEEKVTSIQCHDCAAVQGVCKHAIALLMWVHRRSEEPSCTHVQCYWQKSKLSRVGTTLIFIYAKDLSKGSPMLPSNYTFLEKFLEEGKRRKLSNGELLKYQYDYNVVNLTVDLIDKIEAETRDQFKNNLWYELRYGRVTGSKAYEVSRYQTYDGTLISIMGVRYQTPAMKRGRYFENEVREIVSKKLGENIKNCGLFISQKYPMLAGSPNGLCQDSIIF
ncbi:hypothetical protein HHI36_010176 [Cryptolaemus montrouzieri]|uniref:SWIM-type domain-containing protein n=1 Tax=Cryptolaemus montrouzieri TaxID=559131 RepID=A0ABD2MI07_9CUCU